MSSTVKGHFHGHFMTDGGQCFFSSYLESPSLPIIGSLLIAQALVKLLKNVALDVNEVYIIEVIIGS